MVLFDPFSLSVNNTSTGSVTEIKAQPPMDGSSGTEDRLVVKNRVLLTRESDLGLKKIQIAYKYTIGTHFLCFICG